MVRFKFQIGLVIVVLGVMGLVFLGQKESGGTGEPALLNETEIENVFGQLPLLFVENQGQWDEQVAYAVQGSDKTLYFTGEGVTFALDRPGVADEEVEDGRPEFFQRNLPRKPTRSERWVVKLDFVGANPDVVPVGEMGDSAVVSYFKGGQEDWNTGLPTYRRIVYHDLWPGIDLVYEGTVNRLKYHFVVAPGADPDQIRLAYRGASDVSVNGEGQLVVETSLGGFEDDTPVAYQEINGERVLVDMAYALGAETADSQAFHFDIGAYDSERPLILDPAILISSGYVGGSGEDAIIDVTVDALGNIYATGSTGSDDSTFPVMVGPDVTYNGNTDAFVVKIDPTGTELIYVGYIGGGSYDDGYGIVVNDAGNAFVAGTTLSDEATFPVVVGPDLTHNGDYDVYVAKLNSAGTGLDFAGFIGGDDYDGVYDIGIDGQGNVYLTGDTGSDESTFPVLIGPDLTFNGDLVDAFISKINGDNSSLIYSGFIGGDDLDVGVGIAVDETGYAYITGFAGSDEFTFPVLGGPDLTHNGLSDAFIAKVNLAGDGLVYAGYIGGALSDAGYGVAIDDSGNAYIAGSTDSNETSFPVFVGPDLTFNGYVDVFVTKVDPTGTQLVYSGYIGGNELEESGWIAVDNSGSAYLVGYTESDETSFPVTGGPDLTFNGGTRDGFITKVFPSGSMLDYASYIGGDADDGVVNVVVDDSGKAIIVGLTESTELTFPTIGGPDLTHNGGSDGFIALIAQIYSPQQVSIDGPDFGMTGSSYVFTATTSPMTVTLPLTYSWEATGQVPVTHTNGLTDTAVFSWNITGTKTITMTAWNAGGVVSSTHTIAIDAVESVYLPIVLEP